MIRSVTVQNLSNPQVDDVTLTLTSPEASLGFAIADMTGLGPEDADVTIDEWCIIPGGSLNNVNVPSRTIDMRLIFVPRYYNESVADIRRNTYLHFPLGREIRMIFEMVDLRSNPTVRRYYIDGVVKKNTPKIWSSEEGCDITIKCPDPYFKDVDSKIEKYALIKDLLHYDLPDEDQDVNRERHPDDVVFPTSERIVLKERDIDNLSTVSIGAEFTFIFSGDVKNPSVYNRTTNQRYDIMRTFHDGDTLVLDTRMGHKRIYLKDGNDTNMINFMGINSKWIELMPGINSIGWLCEEGEEDLELIVEHRPNYEGI